MGYKLEAVKNVSYIVDYYAILEVEETSSLEEIKKSYKKLAREYHPDKYQTAGEEIKTLSARKMGLITESFSILSDFKSKAQYDNLLKKFKETKSNCISKDGTPILDVSGEALSIDFLVSDNLEFDFKEAQETKAHQLIGFNETVFSTIEQAYLLNTKDEKLKKAYQDQLLRKKMMLDWEETFAWQEVGVLNNKEIQVQNASEYLLKTQEKLDLVKKEYVLVAKDRLLPGGSPLLLGSSKKVDLEEDNLPMVVEAIEANLEKRSEKILRVAEKKQEFLSKMVKVRFYQKLKSSLKKDVVVFLMKSGKILTTFSLAFIDDQAQDVKLDTGFNNQDVPSIETIDANVYSLEFNPELDLAFQVVEFISDVVNSPEDFNDMP